MQDRPDLSESAVQRPYDVFASAYDRFFAPEAADGTVEALQKLVLADLPVGSRVLDLCCGTGRLSEVLVRCGYKVEGVDGSAEMLSVARSRAPEADLQQADVRNLKLDRRYDAVICAYNSIPHLTAVDDLGRLFQEIRRSLSGTFLFDLYSQAAYLERWRGSFAKVEPDCVCVVQASYDVPNRRGENLITIFERNGKWNRSDLKLTTRCYGDEELLSLLCAAGFTSIEKFEGARDLGIPALNGRMFWRCRP